ncbi:MAG: glycosyl hydrolase [Planctomycetota bacterium]
MVLENAKAPIVAGSVHLDSEDASLVFRRVRPSQVAAKYLEHIKVNGQSAVLGENVRLAPMIHGTIVLPHGKDYQPLTTFNRPGHQGTPRQYRLHTYYKSVELGEDEDKIASFILKRGYMATLAENEDGTGASQVFIAQDKDIRLKQLPKGLRGKVSFIRAFPWRWTAKKGYGGKAQPSEQLDVQWRYDWGASGESTLDMEYVPMRHNARWDVSDKINSKENVTHLLGFNEPMQEDQANMPMWQVLKLWPKLQESGLRLGSPCTTDGTVDWLYKFMDEANKRGYRVDFITVHYYKGGWSDEKFIAWMREIHERTGKPLWVTEFNNGARWVKNHNPSLKQNANRIGSYLKAMDDCEFIERYAIFNMRENRALIKGGKLTPAGVRYRDHDSNEAYTGRE